MSMLSLVICSWPYRQCRLYSFSSNESSSISLETCSCSTRGAEKLMLVMVVATLGFYFAVLKGCFVGFV